MSYIATCRAGLAALQAKKEVNILAIESSCDETAAAVIQNGRKILSSAVFTQIPLHAVYGGVVPEIASRAHVDAVDRMVDYALNEAGMIAMRHDCRGTAMPAVTACASGSNAIGEAMRLIRHGYADAVITGGTEAAICPSAAAGFVNMQALSTAEDPNAASLPFDRRRGGFVMGEGAAALVLEEYMHAKARGAKIYVL